MSEDVSMADRGNIAGQGEAEYKFSVLNIGFHPKGSKVWIPLISLNLAIQCEVVEVYVLVSEGEAIDGCPFPSIQPIDTRAEAIAADKEGYEIFYGLDELIRHDHGADEFCDTREEAEACIRNWWTDPESSFPVEARKKMLDEITEKSLGEWRDGMISVIKSTHCRKHRGELCTPQCSCVDPCCKMTNEEWAKSFPYPLRDKKEGEEWFRIPEEELLKL